MARRKHSLEQVIYELRQAEVAKIEGSTVAEASRQIGVTQQTFYRWRAEYGGLRIDQAGRLEQLEAENTRLKRAVAILTLDNQILKEAAEDAEGYTRELAEPTTKVCSSGSCDALLRRNSITGGRV